jgi:copper transport protein
LRLRTWCWRIASIIALVVATVVGAATAAQAHAILETTTPAAGSVVPAAPHQVALTFGESVGVSTNDIQVFNDRLVRVDTGGAHQLTSHSDTVRVRLDPRLPHGTYTVTWRVVSADGHPVSGGFTFSVGAPSHIRGNVPGLGGGSATVGLLLGGARLLGYAGLIAGPGALTFLLLWPAGLADRRARRIIVTGLGTSVVAVVALFAIQGPYSQGQSISHLFADGSTSLVASSHYGHVLFARLALVVVLCVAATPLFHGSRVAHYVAGAAVVMLPVTWAVAGHGGAGSNAPLAALSESIHVAAVTIWLGGLLMLLAVLLPRPDAGVQLLVLPRFSNVALGCVTAIIATGTYQEIREVGLSLTALTTTTYGRLVLAKIAALAIIIVIASYSRSAVDALRASAGAEQPSHQFRVGVTAEVLFAIAALVFTSILVNTRPAKETVGETSRFTLVGSGLSLRVKVSPTRRGPATINIAAFDSSGHPQPLVDVTGSLSLPSRGVNSLPVVFAGTRGSSHVQALTAFPVSGTWHLSLEVQTSPIAATDFAANFNVR